MKISATGGSKFNVGTTAEADDLTAFEADTYTEVRGAEDLGELGDTRTELPFTPASEANRTFRRKGSKDGGIIELICGRIADDPGQLALKAAADDDAVDGDRNFKVTLNDAPEDGTPTIYYFRGIVLDHRTNLGPADNIVRTTFRIGVNSEVLEVPAAPGD